MKKWVLLLFLASPAFAAQPEPPEHLSGVFIVAWECGGHLHSFAVKTREGEELFRIMHPVTPLRELVAAAKEWLGANMPKVDSHVLMVQVGGVCTGEGV